MKKNMIIGKEKQDLKTKHLTLLKMKNGVNGNEKLNSQMKGQTSVANTLLTEISKMQLGDKKLKNKNS